MLQNNTEVAVRGQDSETVVIEGIISSFVKSTYNHNKDSKEEVQYRNTLEQSCNK